MRDIPGPTDAVRLVDERSSARKQVVLVEYIVCSSVTSIRRGPAPTIVREVLVEHSRYALTFWPCRSNHYL